MEGKNTGDYLLELVNIGADAFTATQTSRAAVETSKVQATAAAPESKQLLYVGLGVVGVVLLISILKSRRIF